MLLFANIMHLKTFHVIFLVTHIFIDLRKNTSNVASDSIPFDVTQLDFQKKIACGFKWLRLQMRHQMRHQILDASLVNHLFCINSFCICEEFFEQNWLILQEVKVLTRTKFCLQKKKRKILSHSCFRFFFLIFKFFIQVG